MSRILSRSVPWFPVPKGRYTGGEPLGDTVRVLAAEDTAALRGLVARDPVANIFMDAQLDATASAAPTPGGSLVLGRYDGGELRSALWVGANLVPIQAGPEDAVPFATAVLGLHRNFSSIFGPANAVLPLWDSLRPESTQEAFDVRGRQPLMVLSQPPSMLPSTRVRRSTAQDYDAVLPACAAMFQEELGYSPLDAGGSFYRSRVRSLIQHGHSFVDRAADGTIRFKAELGTVSAHATQIQGVWVHPSHRGEGISGPAMAAVVGSALALAPLTSLYVNDYNRPALATYRRVGFEQVGEFATVLF
ncbi:GNAT family N-acetyltransferase [Arthrobacter sp. JSM 101049]|uniref:GNAT family N-acetyltransferase n=1 Tax=Arthrobacter sp. JSM 101049 TaxID=929097 RepID=UPI0035632738